MPDPSPPPAIAAPPPLPALLAQSLAGAGTLAPGGRLEALVGAVALARQVYPDATSAMIIHAVESVVGGAPWYDAPLRRLVVAAASGETETLAETIAATRKPTEKQRAPDYDDGFHDAANASRFVQRHGHRLRYAHELGRWLVWDGRRWKIDNAGEAVELAKGAARFFLAEAINIDEKERVNFAARSLDECRIRAALALARSIPGVPISIDDLDGDPFALNCRNGTVNLLTGELRPHRREDYNTKIINIDFDPEAAAPRWTQFLEEVFNGNADLIGFARRSSGYSLTADVRERALFICYGAGRNGKSVFIETRLDVAGDYGHVCHPDCLMEKAFGDSIPNDVASLRGARMVCASETEDGRKLAAAKIKMLTGRDRVSARFLRQEFFTFRPVLKLWLSTNFRPQARADDSALWDRIKLLPFDRRFEEEEADPDLPRKLQDEREGILAWMVAGAVEWAREGLDTPSTVVAATNDYRSANDAFGKFIEDKCFVASSAYATSSSLRAAYEEWCQATGETALGARRFGEALGRLGFVPTKLHRGTRAWRGVGIRDWTAADEDIGTPEVAPPAPPAPPEDTEEAEDGGGRREEADRTCSSSRAHARARTHEDEPEVAPPSASRASGTVEAARRVGGTL